MKIITKTTEDRKNLFNMMNSSETAKSLVGKTLQVDNFCVYTDKDSDDRLLGMQIGSEYYGSNSKTLIEGFECILEIMGSWEPVSVQFVENESKNGRNFLSIVW